MRRIVRTRLSSSGPAHHISRQSCPLCESHSVFHLHCMICRQPMDGFTASKTCSSSCRTLFKRERRRLKSILCWVIPDDGGKKLRRWLPRRIVGVPHTGVYKPSGARRRKKGQVKGIEA
jgi:predicted nucleic acid-binding Zn ribbon protein